MKSFEGLGIKDVLTCWRRNLLDRIECLQLLGYSEEEACAIHERMERQRAERNTETLRFRELEMRMAINLQREIQEAGGTFVPPPQDTC